MISGQISMTEFEEACHILSQHTGSIISKEDIVNMARNMDKNKDGYIDFAEFLEAFCIVDQFGKELIARRGSLDLEGEEGGPKSPGSLSLNMNSDHKNRSS